MTSPHYSSPRDNFKLVKNTAIIEREELPFSEEAEVGVLASILISEGGILADIQETLSPEHFFREKHRIIYQTMLEMAARHDPVDISTIIIELDQRGKLEAVEGAAYVSSLPNHVPSEDNAAYYARIVRETHGKRLLVQASEALAGTGYSNLAIQDVAATLDRVYTETKTAIGDIADTGDLFDILSGDETETVTAAKGIVGDILYEDSVAILYGASGRWKSFLALDWSLRIATGQQWFGRETHQGHVIYIAGEGGRGIGKRVSAWRQHHYNTSVDRFHLLPVAVNLLDDAQVEKLIRSIKAALGDEAPVLIVIDTLSRSMAGGDENTGKDGSKAFAAADTLKQAFSGTTVLLVAHPGKNETNGIRGWSGYFQWADTVMRVSGGDKPRLNCGDVVKLESEKPKDSEPFTDIYYTAQKIEWESKEGYPASSLVLVTADKKDAKGAAGILPSQQQVLTVITERGPIGWHDLEEALVASKHMSKGTLSNSLKELESIGKIEKHSDRKYSALVSSSISSIELK